MCPLGQEPKEIDLAGIGSWQIPQSSGDVFGVEASKEAYTPWTRQRMEEGDME